MLHKQINPLEGEILLVAQANRPSRRGNFPCHTSKSPPSHKQIDPVGGEIFLVGQANRPPRRENFPPRRGTPQHGWSEYRLRPNNSGLIHRVADRSTGSRNNEQEPKKPHITMRGSENMGCQFSSVGPFSSVFCGGRMADGLSQWIIIQTIIQ